MKDKIITLIGLTVISGIVFIIAAMMITNFNTDNYIRNHFPFYIQTPGGWNANPNWYCENIDPEKRIGYNCTRTGQFTLDIFPEYHMAAGDAWIKR